MTQSPFKFFLIGFFSCCFMSAAGADLNFKVWSVEDGLSSNTVYDIIQDSEGFMWIATEDGINRFDGYDFIHYRHNPRDTTSIVNNYVYCLHEDYTGNIWLGTQSGICYYDRNDGIFRRLNASPPGVTGVNGRINALTGDDRGRVWIASQQEGVFIYDPADGSLTLHSFDRYRTAGPSLNVTCIYRDREGVTWASAGGTEHTIYIFDRGTDTFVPAFEGTAAPPAGHLLSYAITEDVFGTVWLASWDNGLFAVDRYRGIVGHFLHDDGAYPIRHAHSITEYEPGRLMIGSNEGLAVFAVSPSMENRLESHITEPELSDRFVYPIYKDREGGLWVGTYYGGINYTSPNRRYFAAYRHDPFRNSLSGNVVSAFCEDGEGNIWIGTDDGGLNRFDPRSEEFRVYLPGQGKNSLSYHNIHALLCRGDELWIGTYSGGLNVMDLRTGNFRHYYHDPADSTSLANNSIYGLMEDSHGNLWIGTTVGIQLYDPAGDRFIMMKRNNGWTIDIAEYDGRIWFATSGEGLVTYDPVTGEWGGYRFDYNDPGSLISDEVNSICPDAHGNLWIGTNTGLCRYDRETGMFITPEHNLPVDIVCRIFPDNGLLWLTTTRGLIEYDPASGSYRRFNSEDNLTSDQFTLNSGIRSSTGRIYAGTVKGFNAFYPRQVDVNRKVPTIRLTEFSLGNQPVDINEYAENGRDGTWKVILPHNSNTFGFGFSALSYYAPEKNNYAYMLEGFDTDWIYPENNRRASYTNIQPGDYVFRVKASNNDGVWNENGLAVHLSIRPPIWWNNVAISVYILAVAGAVAAYIRALRKKYRREHNRNLEKMRNEQEKEIFNSKINFFTTIAHEIRTPVSLIIGPLEQINEQASDLPPAFREDLNTIGRNSQRLLHLVNQLLDIRKIERETFELDFTPANVFEVLSAIYRRFKPVVERKGIEFVLVYDTTELVTGLDTDHFTKVVSNLLSNAAKFAQKMVVLSLEGTAGKGTFTVSVTDDGPGIDEEKQEKIFQPFYQVESGKNIGGTGIGLYLVRSVVEAWQGKVSIDSQPGKGTKFTVSLPLTECKASTANTVVTGVPDITHIPVYEENPDLTGTVEQQTGGPGTERKTILVAEDNPDMLDFICRNLSPNYNIVRVTNGLEALDALYTTKPDIILSDIMMPGMDGIELCNRVKGEIELSHIPFVLLTAKTNIENKVEALEYGADAYIEKPFSVAYLTAQLKNLIRSREELKARFSDTPLVPLKSMASNKTDEDFLARVSNVIEEHIADVEFGVGQLAAEIGISRSGLFAKIQSLSGVTPNKLLLLIRLKKAAGLLLEGNYRVNEVCYMVGFNNPSYFSKCFYKQFNVLPKDFTAEHLSQKN